MKTVPQVLNTAADILEKFGWIQHSMAVDTTYHECPPRSQRAASFCLIGACTRAISEVEEIWTFPEAELLDCVLIKLSNTIQPIVYRHPATLVSDFNDDKLRNRQQCIDILRKAANE